MKNNRISIALTMAALLAFTFSCSDDEDVLPKPRGYFRIDLPEKTYIKVDTIERYSFECPDYAHITPDPYSPDMKNWVNVEMPRFKGTIHLTHRTGDSLAYYLEDVHTMMSKHITKANGINDSLIVNNERQIYGMLIEIDGKGVATPMQFYLTDSTDNFLYGALYFNFHPNNDSMRPIIKYIREDIDHMINTFDWK